MLLAHREILEPVHYMRYIFFLQAHLNRIYQVGKIRVAQKCSGVVL